ncbi:hypothetical protein F5Y09DRAFT_313602 [Xylaria sp. FL1042]|nr:hypothetical protein F5Y09DRAFT_313602 [Xylaria sp. FL1042]
MTSPQGGAELLALSICTLRTIACVFCASECNKPPSLPWWRQVSQVPALLDRPMASPSDFSFRFPKPRTHWFG